MSKLLVIYTPKNSKAELSHQKEMDKLNAESQVCQYFGGTEWKSVKNRELSWTDILLADTIVIKDCEYAESTLTALLGYNIFGKSLYEATEEHAKEFQEELKHYGFAAKNLIFSYDRDEGYPLGNQTEDYGQFASIGGGIDNFINQIIFQVQMAEEEESVET
ncbi:MAG: hypothetical protein ACRCZZ_05410 [Phocaeicola sp.]